MVRLTPKPLVIEDYDGFTVENDIFGYREFGERLANLVCNLEDESLTIALDGPWGSGKSTFAKQWAGHLRQRGMPVIYFDAFAADYHQDPFMALTEQIFELGHSIEQKAKTSLADELSKVGVAALPFLLKAGTNIAVRLGSGLLFSSEELTELQQAVSNAMSDGAIEVSEGLAEKIQDRFIASAAASKSMSSFKSTLQELVEPLSDGAWEAMLVEQNLENTARSDQLPKRLVFIVDELDRCRPDFAIGILEAIKHVFGTRGVSFVLVTSTDHLRAVYHHKYGHSKLSANAIDKFISMTLSLPGVSTQKNISFQIRKDFLHHLWVSLDFDRLDFGPHLSGESLATHILLQTDKRQYDLRKIKTLIASLARAFSSFASNRVHFAPIIVDLCLLHHSNSELYQRVIASDVMASTLASEFGYNMDEHWGWLCYWDFILTDQDISFSNSYQRPGADLVDFNQGKLDHTNRKQMLEVCRAIVTELADH